MLYSKTRGLKHNADALSKKLPLLQQSQP